MRYRIAGRVGKEQLTYEKATLAEAAHLASKMADQGLREIRVLDETGLEVDTTNAPLPPGWVKGFPGADLA